MSSLMSSFLLATDFYVDILNFTLKLSSVNNSFSTQPSLHLGQGVHGLISALPEMHPLLGSSST